MRQNRIWARGSDAVQRPTSNVPLGARPMTLGQASDALAQDLMPSFGLEALAHLSGVNQAWRRAALNDVRVRYDCARPQTHQADSAWWRRDTNASRWHDRVLAAIQTDTPRLLALYLSMARAADAPMFDTLTRVIPGRPAEPSYLIYAAQVPAPRCVQVLLNAVRHSAAGVCIRGWRASRYAYGLNSTALWRTLRIAELAEGETLDALPYPAEPAQPTLPQAFPARALASGDYAAIVVWVEHRRTWYSSVHPRATGWVADLDRALRAMPRTESLTAKWAMRKLTHLYARALPPAEAWMCAMQALFRQHPRLDTSPYAQAYKPLEADTLAAIEEIWRNHPMPALPHQEAKLRLIDGIFDRFLERHSAARSEFLSHVFSKLEVGCDATAPGNPHTFAQRAYRQGAMAWIVKTFCVQGRPPGLLTPDRNFLHCMLGEIRKIYCDDAKRTELGVREVAEMVFSPGVIAALQGQPRLLLQRDAAGKTPTQLMLTFGEHIRAGIELLGPIILLQQLLAHFPQDIVEQSLTGADGHIDVPCGAAIQDILDSAWLRRADYRLLHAFLHAQRLPAESYRQRVARNFWHVIEAQT